MLNKDGSGTMRKISIRQTIALLDTRTKVMLLFALEGVLWQYVSSVIGFGNALYATNMGATDTQIGLIQTVPNLVAIALMLPCGALSDRMRSARTLPVCLSLFMGVMYIGLGTVPALGAGRMVFFFVFLALTSGVLAAYNAQWQSFFGEAVGEQERNGVYAFRNRFLFIIGMLAPLLCGAAMSMGAHSEEKLMVLRVFYYTCALAMFALCFVVTRIPCPVRAQAAGGVSLTPRALWQVARMLFSHKPFRTFFTGVLFFYLTWHIDWSVWYIGEVQYVGLTEWQLSVVNACASVASLLSVGLWAKKNDRGGVERTFPFGVAGLMGSSAALLVATALPVPLRPAVFIALQTVACFFQGCIALCMVQLLLRSVPEHNRALCISLYTMIITLSNSLLPLAGVRIYTLLGADMTALRIFYVGVLLLRGGVLGFYLRRAARAKNVPSGRET